MSNEGQLKINETRNAIDGYQSGITDVLEKELHQMKEDTEKESARIITEAKKQAQDISDQAEQKAKQEAKEKTKYEVEHLLSKAQEEAKKAVDDIKNNALQRSHNIVAIAQQQGEKTAKKIKEEATKVAEDMNHSAVELKQNAEKEAAEIREKASQEADQIIKNAMEAARAKVSVEESKILDDSEQLANLIQEEASSKIKEILEVTVKEINQAKLKFNLPTPKTGTKIIEESKPIIENETQPVPNVEKPNIVPPQSVVHDTPQVTKESVPINEDKTQIDVNVEKPHLVPPQLGVQATPQDITESKPIIEKKTQPDISPDKPRSAIVQPEVPATTQAQSDILFGSIELHVTDGADPEELSEWTKALRNIPLLRVLSMEKSASEQGNKFLILTDTPTPLIGILKKMSSVKEVRKENDRILVTLSGRGSRHKATSR